MNSRRLVLARSLAFGLVPPMLSVLVSFSRPDRFLVSLLVASFVLVFVVLIHLSLVLVPRSKG